MYLYQSESFIVQYMYGLNGVISFLQSPLILRGSEQTTANVKIIKHVMMYVYEVSY